MINNNKNIEFSQKFFVTDSLPLATSISLNYSIDSLDKTDPTHCYFIFERQDGLDQLIENFHKQRLQVEPQAFYNQLRAIKARVKARDYVVEESSG